MSPLISAGELLDRLGEPSLVICDVRSYLTDPARGRREYLEGHVPGALFLDSNDDLADLSQHGRGRHPLPSVEDFVAVLRRLGISPADTVVAYDASSGANAARLWWMLRSIGHPIVRVLDGGFAAWVATGGPVTAEVPAPVASDYPVTVDAWRGIVEADEIAGLVATGVSVVDARAAERYRGETEPIDAVAGHIPGAVNRPHLDNLDASGRHRPAAELAARFDGLGPEPIVYCGSGVTACHDLLAMAVAGIDDARLYPGSWSEWSSDPSRPVATGDQP